MKVAQNLLPVLIAIGISTIPIPTLADISDEWQKSNIQNQKWALQCQEKWDNAKFVDTSFVSNTSRVNSNHPYRWIVTPTYASKITLYEGKPDTCSQMGAERIGSERKTSCFDTNIYIIPDEEAKRKRIYECVTLLKLEQGELVEYTKSRQFGLVRKVVGMPLTSLPLSTLR